MDNTFFKCERDKKQLLHIVLLCAFIMACIPELKVNAAPMVYMCPGETGTFSNPVDGGSYSISSHAWGITSGSDVISLSNKMPGSCDVTAVKPGKASLCHQIKWTYTYYIYEDVQRTKKKYITNTDIQTFYWDVSVGSQGTISFDPNGGTCGLQSKTIACVEGNTYGELPTPAREGYVFDGWYTAKDGGFKVVGTTELKALENHTLYAGWINKNNYKIRFDGNGADSGVMEDLPCVYGTTCYLPGNTFLRTGYRFVGWSRKSDAETVSYVNRAAVSNLTKTEGAIITLYAVWSDKNLASGKQDGYTWCINPENILIITGTGAISFDSVDAAPWYSYSSQIEKVELEEGITAIGKYAFCNLVNMTEVTIPNSVTEVGEAAFGLCRALKNVELPSSVTIIGKEAFDNCNSLESVDMNGVTVIGEKAFFACNRMKNIYIPATVKSIGKKAFDGMNALQAIEVDSENTSYEALDGVLFDASHTTLLQYPLGKTDTSYRAPNGVKKLGTGAFSGVYRLKTLIVPSSVTDIGNSCFSDSRIGRMYYLGVTPPVLNAKTEALNTTFSNVKANIYYPLEGGTAWQGVMSDWNNAGFKEVPSFEWNSYTLGGKLSECDVITDIPGDEAPYIYDGNAKVPAVVKVTDGAVSDIVLEENVDYSVSYNNNVNAGTASIILTGLGSYENTKKEIEFVIYKKPQTAVAEFETDRLHNGYSMKISNINGIGEIKLTSSNPSVATVEYDSASKSAIVTPVGIGKTDIVMEASGNDNYDNYSCSFPISVAEHLGDEGVVTAPPTTSAEGVRTFICEICGHTWIEHIPKLPEEEKEDGGGQSQTGNNTTGDKQPSSENNTTDGEQLSSETGDTKTDKTDVLPTLNKVISDKKNNATVKVIASGKIKDGKVIGAKAQYKSPVKFLKKITIPATVDIEGVEYTVTEIAPNAFNGNKTITSVIIGKNITKIGKGAFSGCKRLKTIKIKSEVITNVGANAIKGIKPNATITVPKKKLTSYKKKFTGKTGYKKTMKIKK